MFVMFAPLPAIIPVTLKLVPTFKLPAMPTPPLITSAPVTVDIDVAVDKNVAVVVTTIPFFTLKSIVEVAISFPFHVTASYFILYTSKNREHGVLYFVGYLLNYADIPIRTTLTTILVGVGFGVTVNVTVPAARVALNTPNSPALVLIPYSFTYTLVPS